MDARLSPFKTFIFDWDGTIVDSAQLGLNAFEKSFAAMGREFPRQTYEAAYSPNWYTMYEAMGVPREQWQTADDLWIKFYGEQTASLLGGVRESLTALRAKGFRLGVVTSGSNCRVTRELEDLELNSHFDVVVCNEQIVNKKPHPEGLHIALNLLATPCEQACYVGDSPEDIQMGRQAKVFTVGVRSSYPTSWRLKQESPDLYLESLTELTNYL